MNIQPFVRYVHYIPIDSGSLYPESIPYDNRLFYMYKGSVEIEVGSKKILLNEGDLVLIPAGNRYKILPCEAGATYIAVNFDYTQKSADKEAPIPPASSNLYNSEMKLEAIEALDLEPSFLDVSLFRSVGYLSGRFVRLEREYAERLLYFDKICSAILCEILYACQRVRKSELMSSNPERASEIIGYINENYMKKITNERIAEKYGLHPIYISKLIKIHTGMPLHQYLIRIRVAHSVEFLTSGAYSIGEISEKCGFCDIYHFSKCFKQIMGVSPSKYL